MNQVQGWWSWRRVESWGGGDLQILHALKIPFSFQSQVEITRRRIRMMITPDWSVKRAMGMATSTIGKNNDNTTPPTENLVMRLAFHDCIPYKGGKVKKKRKRKGRQWFFKGKFHIFHGDGCDGCLNWKGMDWERMKPDDKSKRCRIITS